MKVLLVCVLFSLAIAEPQYAIPSDILEAWINLIEPHNKYCIEKSGVEEDKAEKVFEEHFPDDRPFKCYVHCIQLKINLMDSNGDLIIEEIRKHVPEAVDLKDLWQVVNEEKELCEKSYLLFIEVAKKITSYKKNTV